ncbi:MAG: OPT/YSL family transporter [Myxococcales bacterium]|nr:OPT/YSL family transporter [Myxococcales bacterium]
MAAPRSSTRTRRGPYPELTWPAVLVGYFIGSIICISIGYACLILGFSIEGSELAAILGWGILRGILRRSSIVENNINQTIASAVNGASSGMMFSVPALFILEKQYSGVTDFSPYLMVLACITGGVLGLAFVIPLRKQMIDFNRLAFPGGIAVAAILKSPGAGARKALLMIGAAAVSGVVHFIVVKVVHLPQENIALGDMLGLPPFLNISLYASLLTVAAGFLSGRGGLWFGAGGFLCYFLLAPLLAAFGSPEVKALFSGCFGDVPGALRDELFRPSGIGMLIGAATGGIFFAFPLIRSAIKSMQDASKEARDAKGTDAGASAALHDEMPIKLLYGAIVVGAVLMVVIAYVVARDMPLWRAAAMALLGTLWVWIAGVIVSECVGRTNWSPLSGMTLIAVTILILVASGLPPQQTIISSVIVGAAICVAISQASDMMLDLKSGYLVGASPRKQQIGQILATWLGPILVMSLIFILHKAYGLGSTKLPAPQGGALAGMVRGIIGGDVPGYRYLAGAGLGGVLAFSGMSGIGVLIGLGFYMPFNIVLTYSIGALARMLVDRVKGRGYSEEVGIPLAAGLIVGEALVGVGFAMAAVIAGAVG